MTLFATEKGKNHESIEISTFSGGVLRSLILSLLFVITMTVTSFADVTITKDWDDNLNGTSASSRSAPTVNIQGETSYEKLLNLFYPVGCYFETEDTSFNPNTAWGGTWVEETATNETIDRRKLVWTNSSPNSSFGAQTISINLSEYDAIEIISKKTAGEADQYFYTKLLNNAVKGNASFIQDAVTFDRGVSVSSTGITFDAANYHLPSSTAKSPDDTRCVPYKIYGIKSVPPYQGNRWKRIA